MEERIARIEGILEQMDKRLNHVESDLRELRSDLDSKFKWSLGIVVGILIPMWTTIIIAVLFK